MPYTHQLQTQEHHLYTSLPYPFVYVLPHSHTHHTASNMTPTHHPTHQMHKHTEAKNTTVIYANTPYMDMMSFHVRIEVNTSYFGGLSCGILLNVLTSVTLYFHQYIHDAFRCISTVLFCDQASPFNPYS